MVSQARPTVRACDAGLLAVVRIRVDPRARRSPGPPKSFASASTCSRAREARDARYRPIGSDTNDSSAVMLGA